MDIKVILPVISNTLTEETKKEVEGYASSDTKVSVTIIDHGPASIESEYDEALCQPGFLEKAIQAEKEGYQGIISDCLADPGVKAAREVLNIPVVGPGEAAMQLATSLGNHFSIVTVLPNVVSMLENLSKVSGFYNKLTSIRDINIPVLELNDKNRLKQGLFEEMKRTIEEDGAQVLIAGCTGFVGVAEELQNKLKDSGYDVPVIDPIFAATQMLKTMITMNIKQSKLTYMTPPDKERI